MRILAVDSSTFTGSVAVVEDGRPLAELSARVQARQGEVLLPLLDRALTLAHLGLSDLDLLAVGLGPGSFTGLRIGLATVKGLALSTGLPLRGVSSLSVLARGLGPGLVLPFVDAHKGEVFAAAYDVEVGEALREVVPPFHAAPERAAARLRDALHPEAFPIVGGDGLRRYRDVLSAALGGVRAAEPVFDVPRAALLALEAARAFADEGPSDLASLEPEYLRPSDAKLPERPLRTLP